MTIDAHRLGTIALKLSDEQLVDTVLKEASTIQLADLFRNLEPRELGLLLAGGDDAPPKPKAQRKPAAPRAAKPDETAEAIASWMLDRPGRVAVSDVCAAHPSLSRSKVSRTLAQLAEDGRLVVEGNGRGTRYGRPGAKAANGAADDFAQASLPGA